MDVAKVWGFVFPKGECFVYVDFQGGSDMVGIQSMVMMSIEER